MKHNKHFVQEIIPSAVGSTLDKSPFSNYWPFGNTTNTVYVVYAKDALDRDYVVGYSIISEDDAWKQIAETFHQKMLSQLES